jgi:hypothetical protein
MIHIRSAATVVFFAFMLLFVLPAADSQTIALHPLKGNHPDMANNFFDGIVKIMSELPGPYTTYLINLEDDETLDASGLPAYTCPQDTLTKGAPYAITGEVIEISGQQKMYEIRLYLWDMGFRVLLISDVLVVYEGETETEYLPQLLAWMLSWIDILKFLTPTTEEVYIYVENEVTTEPEKEKEIIYIEREVIGLEKQEAPVEPQYWLYLGLKVGGGDSMWNFTYLNNDFERTEYTIHFLNGGIGVQAAVNLLPWFAIQPEINFSVDLSHPWDTGPTEGTFVSSYLTIPLLFRFNWHKGGLMASIFTGPYFYLPLFRIENDNLGDRFHHEPQIPGFTIGGSIGWKTGPGYLFVDARFEYDGHFWGSPVLDHTFYRNVVKLSIGYELPFLKKRAKVAHVAPPVREEPVVVEESPSAVIVEEESPPVVWEDEIPAEEEDEEEEENSVSQ